MDVKFFLLHGDLQEKNYMEQPPRYIQNELILFCFLNIFIYGFKIDPWAWYTKIYSFLLDNEVSRCHSG